MIFLSRKWGLEEGDEKFEYYMKFLRTVSNNSSYNALDAFAEFENDESINKENLTILMNEVIKNRIDLKNVTSQPRSESEICLLVRTRHWLSSV